MRARISSIGLVIPSRRPDRFIYPDHIDRASLDALPCKPGVYRFLDEAGQPLYIGKSVSIRTRVLSHLRTPEEASMLQQSRRVDFCQTAGEIGALLLEAQAIKAQQPPYNCLLKDTAEAFGLRWIEGGLPQIVALREVAPAERAFVFGLFVSRSAAFEGLRGLLRRHRLCPAVLGMETTVKGRACFSFQTGCCAGACIGKETRTAHDARLAEALQRLEAAIWPYDGPIGIVEENDGWRQTHVVDRWLYIGSMEGRRKKLKRPRHHYFDIDIYKILVKPLLLGELTVVPVDCS